MLLGLALLLMHAEVLTGAATFFHRDFGVLGYPTVFYHREAFWRGELPFWNPLSHCGVPFLAQWGTMVLYPGSLIYLLLPLPWSLNLFCILHLGFGGVGMYQLATRWSQSERGGALAGLAFACSGLTQACLLWPNYIAAVAWVPWVLQAVERAARNGGRQVLVAALVVALQYLTGAPELIGMTWLTAAVAAWAGMSFNESMRTGKTLLWPVALRRLAGVALLALGVTAMQTLPFLELLTRSLRPEGVDTAKWALPVTGLANVFLPLFQTVETTQGNWLQPDQQFLESVYLGPGLLVTAAMAFLPPRTRHVGALLFLAGMSCLLALGDQIPLAGLMRSWLPGFGLIRYPVKFLLLLSWVIPLLAAFGVRTLESGPGNPRRLRIPATAGLLLLGVMVALSVADQQLRADKASGDLVLRNLLQRGTLLVAFLAAGWFSLRALPAGRNWVHLPLLAIMLVDYSSHMPRLNPTLPAEMLAPGTTRATGLPRAGEGRAFILPEAEAQLLHSRIRDPAVDYLGKRLAQWSHLNLLDSVSKVNGAATLVPVWPGRLLEALQAPTNPVSAPLLNFLGVTHVTSSTNITAWEARTGGMPLVWAGQQPIPLETDRLPSRLLASDFAPRREVYLDAPPSEAVASGTAAARILRFEPHRLRIQVTTEAPVLVTIAQTWDPGWRVRFEGREEPVLQANGGFQAFQVPVGNHEFELRYQSRSFKMGLWLAVLSGACGWWVWRISGSREPAYRL